MNATTATTGPAAVATPARGPAIGARYLLVIMLPCYIDERGRRYLDRLWHRDLVGHLPNIPRLTVACPAVPLRDPPESGDLIEVEAGPAGEGLQFIDLPAGGTASRAVRALPAGLRTLWDAVGRADIVHSNVGGWPISYGWFAVPLARLRGRFVLTNVEGAGWRLAFRRPWRLKPLAEGVLFESMSRMCVNLSQLMTATNAAYCDGLLLPWRRHRGHVFVATWIDPAWVLPREQAEATWDGKLADGARPASLVFAGNLLPGKGVHVLLDALERLDRRGVPLRVTIYGRGPLHDRCAEVAGRTRRVAVELGGVLPYGPEFFAMLDRHDALLVPSVSDEQPRNVYDAYARALPVLGGATPGLRQCVEDGRTGWLVPPGDADALADLIARVAADRPALRAPGLAGLEVARATTHDRMHADRAALIGRSYTAQTGRPA